MCYWILTDKGTVIARTNVQHITRDEVATDYYKRYIAQFHEKLDMRLGQGKHNAVYLYVLYDFVNDDVPKPFEDNK